MYEDTINIIYGNKYNKQSWTKTHPNYFKN